MTLILFIAILITVPYICGCAFKCFLRDMAIDVIHTYTVGFVFMWLTFSVIQVPLVLKDAPITVITIMYPVLIALFIVVAAAKEGIKRFRHELTRHLSFKKQDILVYVMTAVIFIAIIAQIYVAAGIQESGVYNNEYTIARAVQIYSDGTLGRRVNAFTGADISGISFDMIMSSQAVFIAMISYIFRQPPLIAANLYIPVIIIPMVYMSYYMAARVLFRNKNNRCIFLIVIAMLSLYSNYSLHPAESIWNLLFINCWNPNVIACHILITLGTYYALTAINAEFRWDRAAVQLRDEKSDKLYRSVIKNRRIFLCKRTYLVMTAAALCFTTAYGIIMGTILYACIFMYYYVSNYGGVDINIKRYAAVIMPAAIYLVLLIITSAVSHTAGSISGFWQGYTTCYKEIFSNDFKNNMYLLIFISAVMYQYLKKESSGKAACVYIPMLVFGIGVINPLIYMLFRLFAPSYCKVIFWILPINAIIAYTVVDMINAVCNTDTNRNINIAGVCLITVISIISFMPRYGYNFAWEGAATPDKISDETRQICDIIDNDGQDKNVIALNELCSQIRLCDTDIKLYYYTDNQYACNDDKDMYAYLNQDEPYLQGIVQNAKREGYNYIIFRKGILDPNWSSVQYHIWPAGSTENYDVYSIGYF
mgnify:FL=1